MFTAPFSFLVPPAAGGFDPDAQAFITAAGITNTTEKTALNDLVLGMKSAGIWSLVDAAYPFVGGTQSSCKYNLVNPVDSDAAYRLNFQGSWTISSGGVRPTTKNNANYADTFWNANNNSRLFNHHFLRYNSDVQSADEGFDGQGNSFPNYIILRIKQIELYDLGFTVTGIAVNAGSGSCFIVNRTSNTVAKFAGAYNTNSYAILSTGGSTTSTLANVNFTLGRANNVGEPNRDYKQFVSLGQGMSDSQAAIYSGLIENFQTTLGRAYAKI